MRALFGLMFLVILNGEVAKELGIETLQGNQRRAAKILSKTIELKKKDLTIFHIREII